MTAKAPFALPAELWREISGLDETGRTALALCLVSRSMNTTIKPVRYANVALAGAAQILSFENQFSREPPWLRTMFRISIDVPDLRAEVRSYLIEQELEPGESATFDGGDYTESESADSEDDEYEYSLPTREEWCIEGWGHSPRFADDDSDYSEWGSDEEWDNEEGHREGEGENRDAEKGAHSGTGYDNAGGISEPVEQEGGQGIEAEGAGEQLNSDHGELCYICESETEEDRLTRTQVLQNAFNNRCYGAQLEDILHGCLSTEHLEYRVYLAIRRVLGAATTTLRHLTLKYQPAYAILPTAIIPPLPHLQTLVLYKFGYPDILRLPQHKIAPDGDPVWRDKAPGPVNLSFPGLRRVVWDKGLTDADLLDVQMAVPVGCVMERFPDKMQRVKPIPVEAPPPEVESLPTPGRPGWFMTRVRQIMDAAF